MNYTGKIFVHNNHLRMCVVHMTWKLTRMCTFLVDKVEALKFSEH